MLDPGPILDLKLRGVGIAETPLVVRFLSVPGVAVTAAENDGRRRSCGMREVVGVEARSRSSSIWDIPPPTDDPCPAWLLREERGRRLSVVGLVE